MLDVPVSKLVLQEGILIFEGLDSLLIFLALVEHLLLQLA